MLRSSIRYTLAVFFAGLLSATPGCLSTSQPDDAGAKQAKLDSERVRCRREYPTGSHISQMVCYRVQHVEDRRQSDQEKMRNMQIGGAIVTPQSSQ